MGQVQVAAQIFYGGCGACDNSGRRVAGVVNNLQGEIDDWRSGSIRR